MTTPTNSMSAYIRAHLYGSRMTIGFKAVTTDNTAARFFRALSPPATGP
jgi:hypothetical protein